MKFEMNKAQRIVVFICAGAILLFQLSVFVDEGVEGTRWVFSFLAVAALLFVCFSGMFSGDTSAPSSGSSTVPRSTDPAAQLLNRRALDAATLTAQLATQLENHFRLNDLDLAIQVPGNSLTTEAVLPVYGLATVAYLETKDPLLTTEYIIYRDLIAKALRAMIASHLDRDSESMARRASMEPSQVGISTGLEKEIAALVSTRMSEQHGMAMKIVQAAGDRAPFISLYKSIAVGSQVPDQQLVERYETVFFMILDQIRRAFSTRPAAHVG